MGAYDFPGLNGAQIQALIVAYAQPLDADLTAIAALAPADGAFLRRTGGAWVGAALAAGDVPDLSATYATLTGIQTLTNKTLTTPTVANLTNMQHHHQNAAGGGQLDHGLALTGLSDDDHSQYLYNAPAASARNLVTAAGTGVRPLGVKLASGQSANAFEVLSNADAVLASIGAAGALTLRIGAAATESANLVSGSFVVPSGWSQLGTVLTKVAGIANNATMNLGEAANEMYHIVAPYTRTAGTLSVAIGGVTHATTFSAASGTIDIYIFTTGTGDLSFIADAAFAGTVDPVVTRITASAAAQLWQDTAGTLAHELRVTGASLNSIFIGVDAGKFVTTGSRNTALGYRALRQLNIGQHNTAVGYNALTANQNYYNTAIGSNAMLGAVHGGHNVAIGYNAIGLGAYSGSNNVAVGDSAMLNATGLSNSIALGTNAMQAALTGIANTAVGMNALLLGTAFSSNTAIGSSALTNATGASNTALGANAGFYSSSGTQNVFIGADSGGQNTGAAFASASNNVIIGYRAGYNLAASQANVVFIGNQAGFSETGSNLLYIEPSSSTTPLIWGDFANDIARINGTFEVKRTSASTNAVANAMILNHRNATPAASNSFGVGLFFTGDSSTTADVNMGRISAIWSTATHASRVSNLKFSVFNIGTETDVLTLTPTTIAGLPDTDATVTLGRARLASSITDEMQLSHFDISAAASIALRQVSTGQTIVNAASGQTLSLRINNASMVIVSSTQLTLADPVDVVLGTTTGTKIATSVSQKLGFHNSVPTIQRAGAAQVAVATTPATNTTPYGFTTAAQADAIITLLNEIRATLVEKGLMKGAA